ncbi:hypothetical protein ACMTAU_22105, partial [Alcaligenes pakistanensis]
DTFCIKKSSENHSGKFFATASYLWGPAFQTGSRLAQSLGQGRLRIVRVLIFWNSVHAGHAS